MGTVTLSVDAELGWGWHDLESPPAARIEAARTGWKRLGELCERFDVPATWAIVGHLMVDDCDGRHLEHPVGSDWFEREVGEWKQRRDLRFAGELVDELLEASVDHDIGCHAFSHVPFGAAETTEEIARAEIELSHEAAADRGLSLDTFVFPRNDVGHRNVLAECGIEAYRGLRPTTLVDGRKLLGAGRKLVRGIVPGTNPPIVEPRIDEYGMVEVPASLYLFGVEGAARTVVETLYDDPIVVKARRGIDAAANSDGVFHLWLHPNNLVDERDLRRMRAVLSYVSERRRAGDVDVATMSTVAEEVTADA